jgi:hypothetical protein
MSGLVVVGQLVDQVGLCQTRSVIVHPGPWPQRVEHRTDSFQLKPTSFKAMQPACTLTVEHDDRAIVGRLVMLEHDDQGVWAVATADTLDLLRDPRPWYLSAEARWQGGAVGGTDIELEGISVVRAPGASGVRPVQLLAGDLHGVNRRSQSLDTGTRGRIERAADLQRHRQPHHPLTIYNRTSAHLRELRRLEHPSAELAAQWAKMERDARRKQPPGRPRIEYGAPVPNSILSVS